ncbi:MAG TPA: hypothetical protein PKW42_10285, partial [bacterium]|nr:hypothetical protein [bacterium]
MASLTRQQKEHLLQWLLMVLPGEVMVLRYPGSSRFLLRMAGVSFLAGGWLRLLGCYPGKPEPLALDFVSGFLA